MNCIVKAFTCIPTIILSLTLWFCFSWLQVVLEELGGRGEPSHSSRRATPCTSGGGVSIHLCYSNTLNKFLFACEKWSRSLWEPPRQWYFSLQTIHCHMAIMRTDMMNKRTDSKKLIVTNHFISSVGISRNKIVANKSWFLVYDVVGYICTYNSVPALFI